MPGDPYSRLLAGMMPFHNRFRMIYASIQGTLRQPHPQTMPQRQLQALLRQTLDLTHHLDGHHQIEETYIFPLLARRMPQFATTGNDGDTGHIQEHARMHAALEQLQSYAEGVERALRGSQGRKAISEGAGQPAAPEEAEGDQDDDADDAKRKPWPTSLFDSEHFRTLIDNLGTTLFPHLEAEETSLRPSNIKAAGFTPEELARIPM
ncbi:hypothetical protein OC835_005551 [Tilletia horrida]|nr:hypothetical protein OC835_005551 [Tilletia horrida]